MSRLEFIGEIPDRNLQLRIKKILLDLMVLGEAAAVAIDANLVTEGKPGSKMPRDPCSLYEEWLDKFRFAAPDTDELEALCTIATRELLSAKGGQQWQHSVEDTNRLEMQRGRDEAKDIGLLIEHRQGDHCAVLSVEHHWPLGWIKAQRIRAGQEPIHGIPCGRWQELDQRAKRAKIAELQSDGLTQKEAALQMGVAVRTVATYWPRRAEPA